MSWAEIKKAINSNISKTLDALIIEKASDELSKINSISNIVTVAGNIKAVKSVQRGTITLTVHSFGITSITISSINPDKSVVLLSGSLSYDNKDCLQPYPYSLRANNIDIGLETNPDYDQIISWQVIEFY